MFSSHLQLMMQLLENKVLFPDHHLLMVLELLARRWQHTFQVRWEAGIGHSAK